MPPTKLTDNAASKLDLWWVTVPPIHPITEADLQSRVQSLGGALVGWTGKVATGNTGPDDVVARDWQTPKRTQQQIWNDRANATEQMQLLLQYSDFGSDTYAAEYRVGGVTVGIIIVDSGMSPVYVEDLLTHTGTAGAGGLLIEHVVAKSLRDWGGDGKLKLCALDRDAAEAYLALGFTVMPGKAAGSLEMSLDPASSPLWQELGDTYVLAKTAATQRFIA